MDSPLVNIVMLVRDRWSLTEQSLCSLYANTPKGSFTLTLVDDASLPETQAKLAALALYLGAHLVRNDESLGVGGSRNRGVAESIIHFGKAKWLYLSDNDVFFLPDWLLVLTEAMKWTEGEVAILGGYAHPYSGRNKRVLSLTLDDKATYEVWTLDALGGLSWLLSYEMWEKYGLLNSDSHGTCQSEDWEYCQRVHKSGMEVAVVEPRVILNTGRTSTEGRLAPGADVASPLVEGVRVE